MAKIFTFKNHAEFVGACEQFAEDMVDFITNVAELEIIVLKMKEGYNVRRLGGEPTIR